MPNYMVERYLPNITLDQLAAAATRAKHTTAQMTQDGTPIRYLRSIFAEIGFRGSELEMRTRLFVGFHSMESALHSDLTEAKKKTHLRLRHALLTRR